MKVMRHFSFLQTFLFAGLTSTLLIGIGCGSNNSASIALASARSQVSFGQVAINTPSVPMNAVLENNSNSSITIASSAQISGTNTSHFVISASTCTSGASILAGGSCSVTITFTPTAVATYEAALDFGSGAIVALTGAGVVPVANILATQVSPSIENTINALYVNLTICEPGTQTCQTIPKVLVDTGSNGLRLLASAVRISLPQMVSSGSPLANCVQFADLSYAFGPIKSADVRLSGEIASSQPIQIMSPPGFAAAPSSCAVSGGTQLTDVASLGGNGILGIGLFKQDCGPVCAAVAIPGLYYRCTSGTCTSTTMPVANQLQNVVPHFPQDNNGFVVTLPAVGSSGSPTVNGTIVFGIGTRSNNQPGSASFYTADPFGHLTTTYQGNNYSSFIDSGSNGLFFLTSAETGLADCPSRFNGFYCPASPTNFSVTTRGTNLVSGTVAFNITSATSLFTSHDLVAFNNLGGPFPNAFDFGLPFFFGKRILFGIEDQVGAGQTGPFYAY